MLTSPTDIGIACVSAAAIKRRKITYDLYLFVLGSLPPAWNDPTPFFFEKCINIYDISHPTISCRIAECFEWQYYIDRCIFYLHSNGADTATYLDHHHVWLKDLREVGYARNDIVLRPTYQNNSGIDDRPALIRCSKNTLKEEGYSSRAPSDLKSCPVFTNNATTHYSTETKSVIGLRSSNLDGRHLHFTKTGELLLDEIEIASIYPESNKKSTLTSSTDKIWTELNDWHQSEVKKYDFMG